MRTDQRLEYSKRISDLARAVTEYAVGHRRMYPPDWGTLVTQGYLKPELLLNPRLPNRPEPPRDCKPPDLADWVNRNSDYVLRPIPRLAEHLNGSNILVYEKVQPGLAGELFLAHTDVSVRVEDGNVALAELRKAGEDVPDQMPGRNAGPRSAGA